ncbi:Lsr2 family protein [Pseudonocardia sp. C8]|nr:Lsr2 family protein [Pseudonocardia sp. C8]
MAKVETIRLVDDITGGEADETVGFGLDGRSFEIDLSSANARRLRDDLAPYLAAARPAGTPGARKAPGRASAPVTPAVSDGSESGAAARERNRAVRVWARENGFTVSERGRIPSEIVEAYHRGTPAPAAAEPEPVEPEPTPAPATDRPQPPVVEFSG